MRRWGHEPTFPLRRIQELVAAGDYDVTDTARRDAESLTFDEFDMVECIGILTEEEHFSHTLKSTSRPGTDQDVYRVRVHGFPLYVKLQIDGAGRAIVISFKRDESV